MIQSFLIISLLLITGWCLALNKNEIPDEILEKESIESSDNVNKTISEKPLFSKNEIQKKLENLSASPAPSNLSPGAMCYDVCLPDTKADYICQTCNEKTIYTYDQAEFIQSVLPFCRRLSSSIPGIKLTIDESNLCSHCKPQPDNGRTLSITVHYPDGTTNTSHGITSTDIQILEELLSGTLIHKGQQGIEIPLKDYLDRIQKILGITLSKDK